jgi:hypothetical protein
MPMSCRSTCRCTGSWEVCSASVSVHSWSPDRHVGRDGVVDLAQRTVLTSWQPKTPLRNQPMSSPVSYLNASRSLLVLDFSESGAEEPEVQDDRVRSMFSPKGMFGLMMSSTSTSLTQPSTRARSMVLPVAAGSMSTWPRMVGNGAGTSPNSRVAGGRRCLVGGAFYVRCRSETEPGTRRGTWSAGHRGPGSALRTGICPTPWLPGRCRRRAGRVW